MATTSKNRIAETNGKAGKKSATSEGQKKSALSIPAPNMETVSFRIIGTSPYVQNAFSEKAKQQMMQDQKDGPQKKKKREKKDFDECYENAKYKSSKIDNPNGWIPATAFRAAMVAACRNVAGLAMTSAKQAFYVHAETFDDNERKPLVRITKGEPSMFTQPVRNSNASADIRARPIWEPGWECIVTITFDADFFKLEEIANLLNRAGCQVGIGEGRNASRQCVGLGWGAFRIATEAE